SRLDGDRVRVARGVPAGRRPRLLHPEAHHPARAAARLHAADLSRALPRRALPRARRLRQALERIRRGRVRLRSATPAGYAGRPRAGTIPRAGPLWRPMAPHQPRHPRHAIRGLIGLVVAACIAWASATRAESSFVPVPEIILDPNEGNTYGVMGVWM